MKRAKAPKPKRAPAKRDAKAPPRSRAPTETADAIDALVEANARVLGLTLDPAWHESIAFNLRLILRHAALVDEFKLPDDAEPAPLFHA
jgi:hypothetical protein